MFSLKKGEVLKKILLFIFTIIVMSSFGVTGGYKGKSGVAPESAVAGIPDNSALPVVPLAGLAVVPLLIDEDEDPCHIYIGGGIIYNRVYATDSGWFDDHVWTQDENGGFVGLVGCEINEYLAVEARWTQTYWDQDYSDVRTYGIYLKPKYPITETITIYGLIGYGNTYVEGSKGDSSNDYSAWPEDIGKEMLNEYTIHWGYGATYDITEKFALFGEFTSTANDLDVKPTKLYDYGDGTDATLYDKLNVDGLTLGVIYKF